MLNLVSILVGVLALVFAIPGFIPLLGMLNWIAVPIAAVGVVIGMMSSKNTGRNINIVIFILAILRLSIGGGLI